MHFRFPKGYFSHFWNGMQNPKQSLIALILTVCFMSHVSPVFAEAKKKKSEPSNASYVLLESLGTVAAQGLYLTYMAIGSLSDGFVSQSYDKDTTKTIMTSYVNLSTVCKNQLGKLLREGELSNEDKQIIKNIETTYGYLILQGQAILDFIDTGDTNHLNAFETNRKEAGRRIDKLLNL
ncbi:hypothetical protein EHQ58_18265 [Leptospira ognonensis]|uniref:Uncharacterized protein n=1 Tax=Leptospira ognonensis TaxID=2484945 RepID=A0A4R9JT19_9LEPT|nr:hypothetical protein [Leptospira ognonensis]TGL55872.1 hypothetical protein EHQ58_18265 [Leptospira ognonensis]